MEYLSEDPRDYYMNESDSDSDEEPTKTMQDTNTFQHKKTPTAESNPYGNPNYAEVVDREALIKKIKSGKYSNLDLIQLSRSSYLKHMNRYNVKNK